MPIYQVEVKYETTKTVTAYVIADDEAAAQRYIEIECTSESDLDNLYDSEIVEENETITVESIEEVEEGEVELEEIESHYK